MEQLVTANGKAECSTVTVTSQLSKVYGFAYSGAASLDWAGAGDRSGPIPLAFAQAAGILSCSPGIYRGAPTLEVPVGTFTFHDASSPVQAVQSVADLGPPAVTSGAVSHAAPSASPAPIQASPPAARTSSATAKTVPAAAVGPSSSAALPPTPAVPSTSAPRLQHQLDSQMAVCRLHLRPHLQQRRPLQHPLDSPVAQCSRYLKARLLPPLYQIRQLY